MTDALFRRDGDTFHPSALTTGPWRADAMHGGPPAALVGVAVQDLAEPDEHVARVTVELERPVPLVALRVEAERRRVSGRVAHIDVRVFAPAPDGAEQVVVSGRGLLLRVEPLPAPSWPVPVDRLDVLDESHTVQMQAWASGDVAVSYHRHAVEHRLPSGDSFGGTGPATAWVRLRQPVIAGEPTSGLCRVLAAADFGSGISSIYEMGDGIGLINADLTIALERKPVGEWVRVASVTRLDASGSAWCQSELADTDGLLGVATQSLLGLRL